MDSQVSAETEEDLGERYRPKWRNRKRNKEEPEENRDKARSRKEKKKMLTIFIDISGAIASMKWE